MKQRSLKKNTIYNAVKTCSSILFPLITFPYISRVLLPENVGKVNFATTFVGYFALIATLGITTYAVRECAASKSDKNELGNVASQIYSINIITTFIAYVLLAGALLLFRRLDSYRTLIIISSTTILFTTLGADWLNTAMEDFEYITLRTVVFQVFSLVAMFIFVKTEADYIKYAIITVVASSGANALNMIYRKRYCKVLFTIYIDWQKHVAPIMLLFAMILSQQILNNTDITMLGLMRSNAEVGFYSTAVKIKNIISQVVFSILWVLLPRLSEYSQNGKIVERNRLLRKALCFLVGLGFPCITGVAVTAKNIILLVGGDVYLPATGALVLLMGDFLFDLLGGSFVGNLIMLPSRQEKYFLLACAEAAFVNVVFNAVFIPRWGIYAAAGATVLSRIVMMISLMIRMDKSIRFNELHKVFIAPVTGCLGIIAVSLIIKRFELVYWLEFIITVIVAVGLYGLVLLIFKYDLVIEVLNHIKGKTKHIALS